MAVGVPITPVSAVVSIPSVPVPGTVAADLVKIQDRLHDTGTIWSAAELLRSYNEAYRRLLTHSKAVKMHYCFDVPPRNAYTYCYEWEDSAITGPSWMCMLGIRAGTYRATTRWERSEEHTSELQSQSNLVCRLLLEKKKKTHSNRVLRHEDMN